MATMQPRNQTAPNQVTKMNHQGGSIGLFVPPDVIARKVHLRFCCTPSQGETTPKWGTFLCLKIDLYLSKASISSKKKAEELFPIARNWRRDMTMNTVRDHRGDPGLKGKVLFEGHWNHWQHLNTEDRRDESTASTLNFLKFITTLWLGGRLSLFLGNRNYSTKAF